MITMKNFRVLVPEKKDALLGYTGENLSRRLTIAVDDPGPWSYKLDIRNDAGAANVMDLIAGDGVLSVDIGRAALQVSGRVQAQVRAINGDAVKCSNIFSLFIGDSVQAVNYFESLPPSEFEQLEANLTAIKSEAQASAQKAKESENNAKAYAEGGMVQNTTYDESGNLAGITATEVTGAKEYQSKAAENAASARKLMLRAKTYAEGGAVEQESIGNVLYPAVDTIGAKGYMEQAQEAADRAEGAAERAEAAGGSGNGSGEGTPGGYYTPTVSQPDANTMRVSYTPSQEGMAGVEQVDVVLPKGDSGKTAYESAVEAGYTGSESEFAAKLAAEHLPVPATAAVGQYFRAKTVDENGLVTEVEAVDATGGGSDHGHWETVLETTWDVPVVTPTAYDAETGIFTCAEGELDALELNTEYTFYQQCNVENVAYNTILNTDSIALTKLSDTTFSISVTPGETFVATNVKFSKGASLAVTDIDTKKIRLTLDGQFHATATLYDRPFYGATVPYFGRNTGYYQIRNAYQAYQQVTAEVESPYRIVGEILCGFNAPSQNGSFHFKNNSFCCPLVPNYDKDTRIFSSDGQTIKNLYSTPVPWMLGSENNNGLWNDYLKIISGTKVKLERWVE